jgi:hypothetical protein
MMKNHASSLKIYRWILERMTLAEITGSNWDNQLRCIKSHHIEL